MLSERDIEAAHPDAFDFVWGNLPSAKRADFNRHLIGCHYCQTIVDEYSEIGQIIQKLPPHVDPPADLEDRTVAAMVAALADRRASTDRQPDAEDQAATRVYPRPQDQPSAEPETRVHPRPPNQAPAAEPADQPAPAELRPRPLVTRLPVWRRHPRRLVAVLAVAAALIIAAAVVVPRHHGGQNTPAQATVVVPLHATAAAKLIGDGAATGQATAHQAGPSWTFDMTVHGLKVLPGNNVYECWWAATGSTKAHPQLVSGGTFVVDNSGSTTVTMTTGVDPRDFRTMEITAESPGTGALQGAVLLTGQSL
jgi:Anti-sigma-K factor rskA, C-terminal